MPKGDDSKTNSLGKSKLRVSVIIPTKNEEKYLPQLLKGLKNQTVKPYEIIVADAGSTDSTVKIAKRYGAKVVKGGIPAVGKNNGALAATGDILLFLDADTLIPRRTFISDLISLFKKSQKPVLFYAIVKPYSWDMQTSKLKQFFQKVAYLWSFVVYITFKLLRQVSPNGLVAVTREQFKQTGLFRQDYHLGEDTEYAARLRKKYGFQRFPYPLIISSRRLKDPKILIGWILAFPLLVILELIKTTPVIGDLYFTAAKYIGEKVYTTAGSEVE